MFKAKWVAALRSGKYKQACSRLRAGDFFCVLGVACDLLDPKAWNGNRWRGESSGFPRGATELAQIGITFEQECKLQSLNDSERLTFEAIADWIETNVDG